MSEQLIQSKIKVLMYHRVVEEAPSAQVKWHWITTDEFRKQMWLIDYFGYTPITFRDYRLYLEDDLSLPRKPIIITFDDGYKDTYEQAAPILNEYNMKAVIFVMGDRTKRYADWDTDDEADRCPLMSDEEILHLHNMGHEIGGHSMNHADLCRLTLKDLKREMHYSKQALEQLLGEQVISFAYPYGRVNERVSKEAISAGYRFGCGVYTGPPQFDRDRYDIRRIAVKTGTGMGLFALKLLTPYEYLEWGYGRLKQGNGLSLQESSSELEESEQHSQERLNEIHEIN